MTNVILGIDIAKLKFDVALLKDGEYKCRVFKNNTEGSEALLIWAKSKDIDSFHACLEATGTYGEDVSYFLVEKGYKVSVVNPAQ